MFTDAIHTNSMFSFVLLIDVKIHFLSVNKREAIWFWNGILSFPPLSPHHSAFLSDLFFLQ